MEAETTPLARKQEAKDLLVLGYIEDFWAKNKTAPTLDEIARGLGLKPRNHKSWVFYACQRLVEAGKLRVVWVKFGKRRSYQVVADDDG